MNIFYIAELNIPNNSAYMQHVMKMCDELSVNNKTTLIVFSKNVSFSQIKRNYLLKNNFKIITLSEDYISNSFFNRIRLSLFVKKQIKNCHSLIISRSIMSSLLLSFFGFFNFLEIHNNLKGFTKYLFKLFRIFNFDKNIFFIFIHKNLLKIFNVDKKKSIILDDAVKIQDFTNIIKKRTLFDCSYVGSLYPGKGLEIIMYLSKEFKFINFHIFGSLQTAKLKNIDFEKYKNLIFHGFLSYSKIPSVLVNSKILLMPYLEKVNVRSSNLEVSNFMSPLKLFDYLASGAIILASKLPVYSHILRNEHNAILASPKNYKDWKKKFNGIISDISSYSYIKKNAFQTAKKFTWERRVKTIMYKYKEINI